LIILLLVQGTLDFAQLSNYSIDLKGQWKFSSIPQKQPLLFPESTLMNDLSIGFNRAGMSWFAIDPLFYEETRFYSPAFEDGYLNNHLVRPILENELYPELLGLNEFQLFTLNIHYYPCERGVYNYDVNPTVFSAGTDSMGMLNEPATRWGGISRKIELYNMLENPKINYIGFWLMDPFVYDTVSNGGLMFIHLGNISEDVLKDGRESCENNLPPSSFYISGVDTSIWGRIGNETSNISVFDSRPESRPNQDVGLDGLKDADERSFFQEYLNAVAGEFGTDSKAFLTAQQDPSSDNYRFYRSNDFDQDSAGIPERYRKYNGLDGNSCIDCQEDQPYQTQASNLPDVEDVNRNGLLDTTEIYYQYRINLNRESLIPGKNFITEKVTVNPANGDGSQVSWYKFLIPLRSNQREEFGNMELVDSMMAIRLILKDFTHPVILRFPVFQLMESDFQDPVVNQPGTVLIYPNPVKDLLEILCRDEGLFGVSIYDLTGRRVIPEENGNGFFYRYQLIVLL
jgi:cell surface protein SprA